MDIFFELLSKIVVVSSASAPRNEMLVRLYTERMDKEVEAKIRSSGSGKNQIRNLQKAGDTRWSSHSVSLDSLIELFPEYRKLYDGFFIYLNIK